MIIWQAKQYDQAWEKIYGPCDKMSQADLDSKLALLLERGNQAKAPLSKSIGNGLFELRVKNIRVFYYFGNEKIIVFVHGFIKKCSKIPKREMRTALRNKKSSETGEKTHGLNLQY